MEEKDQKEEVKELDPQQEYDTAWEEEEAGASKDGQGGEKAPLTDEQKAEQEWVDNSLPDGQEKAETTADDAAKATEEKDPDHGDVTSLRKALDDTKAWNQELVKKNKALAEELDKAKKGTGNPDELEKARKDVQSITAKIESVTGKMPTLKEDYPEVAEALEPILDIAKELQDLAVTHRAEPKGPTEEEQQKALEKALTHFRTEIKPRVLEKHPDFDEIVNQDSGYFAWAEKQRPALKFAALNSSDPEDIVEAVTAYKTFMAKANADKVKENDAALRQRRIQDAQTLRGSSTAGPTAGGKAKSDPNDYEGAWEELEREEAAGRKG